MAAKGDQQIVLPSLQPRVNYHSLPRRYEETKPALVLEFTHKRIIDIGHIIEEKRMERCKEEKTNALRQAEMCLWKQAEQAKEEAIERAVKKVKAEHNKDKKKLICTHEQALKDESKRVSEEVKAHMTEELKQTVQDWERKLEETVEVTKHQCHAELLQAVAEARKEEQKAADEMRTRLTQAFENSMQQKEEEKDEEKRQALNELTKVKDKERDKSVEDAHTSEQQITAKKISDVRNFYDQNIRILQTNLRETKSKIGHLENQLLDAIREKEIIRRELIETREEFELFIHRVQPYNKTDPGFVFPPPKTIVLGVQVESNV